MKINRDKHVWEGWTVGDFIDDINPTFTMIQQGQSWRKPFKTKAELKEWCKNEQSYYKKHIPMVYNYFLQRTDLI